MYKRQHEGIRIGAVENLQGIHWQRVTIEGAANHAGTTPTALKMCIRDRLERMVKDIRWLFLAEDEKKEDAVEAVYLWDDKEGTVRNGRSYGQEEWE